MNKLAGFLLLGFPLTAFAAGPVAYVYVVENTPIPNGIPPISVYAAASNGVLTPIKGSPFSQTTGVMVGTNGSHFITFGNDESNESLYSYPVSSTGAIGEQSSEINTALYSAGGCGYAAGVLPRYAQLDHSGSYIDVVWTGWIGATGQTPCSAIQTFEIAKNGKLTFKGFVFVNGVEALGPPVLTGNDQFGILSGQGNSTTLLSRNSSGVFSVAKGSITEPKPQPGFAKYVWLGIETPDPTDHLAVIVDSLGTPGQQVASFTMSSHGDLVSSNTWENMPTFPDDSPTILKLNPAATFLAVAVGTGTQYFNFDGAEPITPLDGAPLIGESGQITVMSWDSSNHLYGVNGISGRLHVYTVTKKGVVEAPGSPYGNSYLTSCQFDSDFPLCGAPTLIVKSL